jgi:hypothetical protein
MRHCLCTVDSSCKNSAAGAQQEEVLGTQRSLAQPATLKRGDRSDYATALQERDQSKEQTRTCEVSEKALANIMSWASFFFLGGRSHCAAQLLSLLREAQVTSQNELGVKDAIAWGKGFQFSQNMINSDVACLRAAQLNFTAMVTRRLKILSIDRLSKVRVALLRHDNPERTLMDDLAIGMRVFLPAGFIPNGKAVRTPLRESYVAVSHAVNKMLSETISSRLAILLPRCQAQQYVPQLHYCKAHWTPKKGKPSGRPLGDLTYVDGTPVNTDETAQLATAYYGEIIHPTIQDIAAMVAAFTVEQGKSSYEVVLWKMDLKGAYTLLSYRPADVGLFAMELTDELVYLQFVGIFGWSGTPAAFQVVTRALQWEMKHALSGPTLMYVDDLVGVCLKRDLAKNLRVARRIITQLLGSNAVADDKTESGRRMDVIGYTIDLDIERVLISRKNHLKALHGFASINLEGSIGLKEAQKFASWSSRYGMICRVMRPLCAALHRLTAGRTSFHARFKLSQEAKVAIQCWRALLCVIPYDEVQFTRSLASFRSRPGETVAEFDASLSGVGVLWFSSDGAAEGVRGVCALSLLSLGFGKDSSFQNLAEFIGAIVAVIGFVTMGGKGKNLTLRGDSITALTWAYTERTRGPTAMNAAIVWTLLCIAADVHIADTTHLPGKLNVTCDLLSRRSAADAPVSQQEVKDLGLSGAAVLDLGNDPAVKALISICDPKRVLETDAQFGGFWAEARRCVDELLQR